ncbi:SDR family oxidoreductase, partial [Salsipaludibacter albus]|uniref:SDR family oxidoreductase n=1 Tax=Salsipaludibacter albus TaxID=2849650 RepID=UPI001EE454F4
GEVLGEVADEIGGVAVVADVTDHEALAAAVERAVEELGGLDALVNAAGLIRPGGIEETDPDDARLMFEVNVLGLVDATHLALPHLRASGAGDVVNISSMSGRRVPSARHGLYCGTKYAVHAISEGLRLELADQPVRVTVVSPGWVDTALGDDIEGPHGDDFRASIATHGMSPTVVADLVVHALGLPREVELVEVALLPTDEQDT